MAENSLSAEDLRIWLTKWRWHQREVGPLNRARLNYELAKRRAFARGPLRGNILEMLREGRLTIGENANFESDVWLTSDKGRISIGAGTFLNQGVMVAASDSVTIGDHVMIGNGSLITDSDHRYSDPEVPVPWQGFTSKGPVVIGDNTFLGANVVVTTGARIGRRSVVCAGSVVAADIPDFCVAAGNPARPVKRIKYDTDIADTVREAEAAN